MKINATFWTSDLIWQNILSDVGFVFTEKKIADINIDELKINLPVPMYDLIQIVLNSIDTNKRKIVGEIFGANVNLTQLQINIVFKLAQNKNGLTANELKSALGYSDAVQTNSVDTAIYNMRRDFGRDIIINVNGKYYV